MAVSNPINKTTAADESIDNLDDRDIRALVTPMTVMDTCGNVADDPDAYEVTTDSGSCYTVDIHHETCTCPDHEYRRVECKHIRRVKYETGLRAIPAGVDGAMLDDQLGAHAETANVRVAATDGGMTVREAAEGAEVLEDTTAYDLEDVDGGVLVFQPEDVGRRLVGFTDVEDWSAIRSELIRRGIGVGAIHHLEVFEPEEVGR